MNSNFTFLIQTINGEIKHDFSFELLNSIQYLNWYYNSKESFKVIKCELSDIPKYKHFESIVPVGTVEFVHKYLQIHNLIIPRPINIPEELSNKTFTQRTIFREVNKNNLIVGMFTKSSETIKGFTRIYTGKEELSDNIFFQSEIIDIESEYRCFIHKKELVGIQFYLGDFTVFPNVTKILNMISAYTNSPQSYTLDVGVSKELGTFIIEVHNFYSCGLYGFRDYKVLPNMFINWYIAHLKSIPNLRGDYSREVFANAV